MPGRRLAPIGIGRPVTSGECTRLDYAVDDEDDRGWRIQGASALTKEIPVNGFEQEGNTQRVFGRRIHSGTGGCNRDGKRDGRFVRV